MIGMCAQFKMLCENIEVGDKKENGFRVTSIDHTTYKKVRCPTWSLEVPTINLVNEDGYKRQRKPMQLTPFIGKEYITCANCIGFNMSNIRRKLDGI